LQSQIDVVNGRQAVSRPAPGTFNARPIPGAAAVIPSAPFNCKDLDRV